MGLALDEPKTGEDTELINGIEVLMDAKVRSFAAGQALDYVTSPGGQGFVIAPASGTSPCG
nr:hypothetical protein [Desulfuromonas sp.]